MLRFWGNSVIRTQSVQQVLSRCAHLENFVLPHEMKTIEQHLKELKMKNYDAEVEHCVNIGFPLPKKSNRKNVMEQLVYLKDKNRLVEMEKNSRNKTLVAPIDQIRNEWLSSTVGKENLKTIGDHYGIFKTLFHYAYFYPKFIMDIEFCTGDSKDDDIEWCSPVRFGNFIKPKDAANKPTVRYEASDDLWTLLLLNLDGDVSGDKKEHVHWFIGNITGNDLTTGEEIVDYLQPVPPKGTGYHRHVFLLLHQNCKMDYSMFRNNEQSNGLDARKFSTLDFYRSRQDQLTPASFAFFQSNWDESVQQIYHNVFDEEEPIYEYDFARVYVNPKQTWFPIKQAFNLYLDKYRDEKQINKEFLEKRLKNVDPFVEPEPEFKFPNTEKLPHSMPQWLKTETKKARLKLGRIRKMLDEKDF